MPKKSQSIRDLTADPSNANRGTARGRALLKESIETVGFGRPIAIDKHDVVMAGNKTVDEAKVRGAEIEIIETDGTELVVVQRTDLDLMTDAKARQLAYYDNRVQEVDLSWSSSQIQADILAGVNVGCAFFPDEIAEIIGAVTVPDGIDTEKVAQDMKAATASMGQTMTHQPAIEVDEKTGSAPATFVLSFNTVEQQLQWDRFLFLLSHRYPDVQAGGARLARYVGEVRA